MVDFNDQYNMFITENNKSSKPSDYVTFMVVGQCGHGVQVGGGGERDRQSQVIDIYLSAIQHSECKNRHKHTTREWTGAQLFPDVVTHRRSHSQVH